MGAVKPSRATINRASFKQASPFGRVAVQCLRSKLATERSEVGSLTERVKTIPLSPANAGALPKGEPFRNNPFAGCSARDAIVNFAPLCSKRHHLFLVRIAVRKKQSFKERAFNLTAKLTNRPIGIYRFFFIKATFICVRDR